MAYFEFKTNPLYVQGPDALLEIKRYCYNLGQNFLIVTGCGPITKLVEEKVKKSFDNTMVSNLQPGNLGLMGAKAQAERFDKENKKITYSFYDFEGKEVTLENVALLSDTVKEKGVDVIIGIGGGKAMDVVRGVHHSTGCKVVLCPTAIATNAPATALHVNYTQNGEVVGLMKMDLWPNVVLVDLNIVISAPPITLAAGMGDCLATYYESLEFSKILNRKEQLVDMVWHHLHALKQTFFENGYKAVLAAKKGVINPAFEAVVAQIAHMSGATSVSMGAHFSHIVDELLLCLEPTKKTLHGLLVGYGVIPFMVWKNCPIEEIYEYVDFAKSVGIPVSFKDLGIQNISMEELQKAAEYAVVSATAKISLAKLKPEELYRNMLVADQIVNDYLCEQ